MTNITKHDTEQEWERNTSEDSWVNFLVGWNSVSVDNLLIGPGKLVSLEMGWRLDTMAVDFNTPGG